MFYHITKDSFGYQLPIRWAEIAETINEAIDDHVTDDMQPDDLYDLMNEMWARYWNNHLYWYSVADNEDDTSTFYGSFNLETAFQMLYKHKHFFPDARLRMTEVGIDHLPNIIINTDTETA